MFVVGFFSGLLHFLVLFLISSLSSDWFNDVQVTRCYRWSMAAVMRMYTRHGSKSGTYAPAMPYWMQSVDRWPHLPDNRLTIVIQRIHRITTDCWQHSTNTRNSSTFSALLSRNGRR